MKHLAKAWLRTAARAGAHGDLFGAGARLLATYAEPSRCYHDLTHLDEVLRHVDELAPFAADADTVRLAAWFHDAVYDPTRQDNEERSALLAKSVLTDLHVAGDRIDQVARLVRLTATHRPERDDLDGAVLCDADLAILAAGPERYCRYTEGVRAEHAHLTDDDFARGRVVVLRRLLAHETLFHTPVGRASWEAAARTNLAMEIDQRRR